MKKPIVADFTLVQKFPNMFKTIVLEQHPRPEDAPLNRVENTPEILSKLLSDPTSFGNACNECGDLFTGTKGYLAILALCDETPVLYRLCSSCGEKFEEIKERQDTEELSKKFPNINTHANRAYELLQVPGSGGLSIH